jgi:hypothetical protein
LSAACLIVLMSSKAVLAKEKEIVVEVSSTEQLGDYFDSVGYNVAANPDILNAIPRFRFTHIPKNWEEDTSVPLKKSVFFRAGASAILQVNESLVHDRQRLSKIKLTNMSQKERQWLNQMMSTYKVTEDKASFTDDQLRELMVRVDAIPPSLALVQSAIESGWGARASPSRETPCLASGPPAVESRPKAVMHGWLLFRILVNRLTRIA